MNTSDACRAEGQKEKPDYFRQSVVGVGHVYLVYKR